MHRPPTLTGTALAFLCFATTLSAQVPGVQRCGLVLPPTPIGSPLDHPDCDFFNTNPSSAYAPVTLLRIPVVVHVVAATSGTGSLAAAAVQSQIDVLNEDFRAIPGTPGANGADALVEFYLATTDPNGQPTTGIVQHVDDLWFLSGAVNYGVVAWDTARYLNIYTRDLGGLLGQVPDLPQGGTVLGTSADRVEIDYRYFGRPGLAGWPYDQGRSTTHEVGHFLGLFHTFEGGCGTTSCYTSGDRICDTPAEAVAHYGCPTGALSCGSLDPIRNYMDYTDDLCMQGFSPEQVRRLRCTLQHYRPQLAVPAGPIASVTTRPGAGNLNGVLLATTPVLGATMSVQVTTVSTGFSSALAFGYTAPASMPFHGFTILIDIAAAQVFFLPLLSNPLVVTWNLPLPNNNAFAGMPVHVQAALLGSSAFGLTNAADLVLGH